MFLLVGKTVPDANTLLTAGLAELGSELQAKEVSNS